MLLILALFTVSFAVERPNRRRAPFNHHFRGRQRHPRAAGPARPLDDAAPSPSPTSRRGKGFARQRDIAAQRETIEQKLADLEQQNPGKENEIERLKRELDRLKERETLATSHRRGPAAQKERHRNHVKILFIVLGLVAFVLVFACVIPLVHSRFRGRNPSARKRLFGS
jgi:hypothetical protein